MVSFHRYVKLPEGNREYQRLPRSSQMSTFVKKKWIEMISKPPASPGIP